jgi:two-component system sensor histidine kinase TorS
VASLGGQVTVESRLGHGTVFQVELPFAKADGPMPEDRATGSASTVGSHLRILVVEDDATNMEILTSLLNYDGHKVVQAYSGKEARDVFRPEDTDCILSDIRLRDTNGVDLVRYLREIAQQADPGRHIPAIAVTANVMPEDLDAYSAAGFECVVSKPLDERKLYGAIRVAIGAGSQTGQADIQAHAGRAARLKELLGAEEYEKVQVAFRQTLEECHAELKDAIERNDRDRIRFLAHRVTGSAASIGAPELAKIAATVEDQAAGPSGPDRSDVDKMLKSCESVLKDFKLEQ